MCMRMSKEAASSAETEPAAISGEAKKLLVDSGIFYGTAETCRMSAEQAGRDWMAAGRTE